MKLPKSIVFDIFSMHHPAESILFGLYFALTPSSDKMKTIFLSKIEMYTDSQKHESTLLHTYALNKFLTANRSCTTKYF